MLTAYKSRLIFRKDLGKILVHPQPARDSRGCLSAVAGHHDDTRKPGFVEIADNSVCLLADGILDTDDGGEFFADRQIKKRAVVRQIIKLLLPLLSLRKPASFIFKNEMVASDQSALSFNGTCDAVGNDILHLCVPLLMDQGSFFRFTYDRIRDGMREMFLQAGCQTEHLFLIAFAECNHLAHARGSTGQGTGLIKYDRIRLRDCLQELAALHIDMMIAALSHGGKYRDRHRQLQRTGKINHQK